MTLQDYNNLGIYLWNQDGKIGVGTASGAMGPLTNLAGQEGIDVNTLPKYSEISNKIGSASVGVGSGTSLTSLYQSALSNQKNTEAQQAQTQSAAQMNSTLEQSRNSTTPINFTSNGQQYVAYQGNLLTSESYAAKYGTTPENLKQQAYDAQLRTTMQSGTATPPTGALAVQSGQNYENNQTLQAQDFYKIKVPLTASNPGGYDIYRKDGTKITLEAFQALNLNDRFIPDQTGVVDPGKPTGGSGGTGGASGNGTGGVPVAPSGVTGLSSSDLDAKLTQYGINPSGLSGDQKAVFGAMFAFQESQAALGQSQAINNANDFTKYYNEALTRLDPEYKAVANLGRKDFDMAVANLTGDVDFANQQRQQQQEAERTNLSERNAEAGRVYSGFAQKAKEQLDTNQTGVIESSKRALQKDLFGLGAKFEQTYGSAATSPFSIAGQTYNPAGGMFGSQNYSQQQAAIAEAQRKAGLLPYSQSQSQTTQNIINPLPA